MGIEWEYPTFCSEAFVSKLQDAFSTWLKTFVIKPSSEHDEEWEFRTLFVAEITLLPVVLSSIFVFFVFWWTLNRNAKLRKTKGSSIPFREERREENGSVYKNDALMKAYNVQLDDDGETFISMESHFDDSDDDDDPLLSSRSLASDFSKAQVDPSGMFLSKSKRNLWKVVKEFPVFSFFNEEAMEICLNDVEYVDLDQGGDFLWKEGKFDGSLYYVVKGKVKVNFLDFQAPNQRSKENESVSLVHEEDTVVTSQLALIEGMLQHYLLSKSSSLGQFVGLALNQTTAQAMEDNTRLLRIPPSSFSRVMDRFPETMLRIIQTTLNRTQRVTVQTLVRCCGLRTELLVPTNKEMKKGMLKKDSRQWQTLQDDLTKAKINFDSISDEEKNDLTKNACASLANILNIKDSGTIEVLEENCSLLYLDSKDEDSNRTLIGAGSKHDSCYFLLQGVMEMGLYTPLGESSMKELQNDPSAWNFQPIEKAYPGTILGASALFSTDINLFEIRQVQRGNDGTILLQIPKDIYVQLVVKHPRVMAALLVPVLTVLSPVVHFLTWTTEWIHIEAAEEIVQKGTQCDSFFVVLNGRLRAADRGQARLGSAGSGVTDVIPPEEYGRGKIFGQVGSLANVDWPFDVFAIRQSELAKIPIKTIEVVVQNFPRAGLFLARVVASDIESRHLSKRKPSQSLLNQSFPSKVPTQVPNKVGGSGPLPFQLPSYGLNLATIAVVPLSPNVDIKRFCRTMTEAMGTIAPSKLLTKSVVKQELGERVYQNRTALHDVRMTRYLADVEENNRVVIYQADARFTFWTRLSILQADHILLVVDSNEAPKASRVEETVGWAYEAMDVRIDLVVVGNEAKDDESQESNSDASCDEDNDVTVSDQLNNWSESREWIAGHHLVRAPFRRHRIDFHRMCRRISGQSIGLVLGAGGARGIAHLGVIRALMEAGVTVDVVGGTSQGAFCGALFARYPDDYEKIKNEFQAMASDAASMKSKIFDLTLPITSMFAGRIFNRGIKRRLGKLRIQDLVLNFFCVSTDLQNQATAVHTKGQLWKYVRASMGLYGYLPPVAENGSLLVDGGYSNSLPADIMKYQMGARTVIAVDVSDFYEKEYYEYGTHLSGWWVLWNSWNPFSKTVHVPSMGDISDMLIWVSSEQRRKAVRLITDLHLIPPVMDIGTLEFDKFDEIAEKGYNYAKPIVDEWVRQNPSLSSSASCKSRSKSSQTI